MRQHQRFKPRLILRIQRHQSFLLNVSIHLYEPKPREFYSHSLATFSQHKNLRVIARRPGINEASPRYTQVKVMRSSGAGAPKNIARAAPPMHCNPPESMWVKHVPSGSRE
jgi:hypothetical protein